MLVRKNFVIERTSLSTPSHTQKNIHSHFIFLYRICCWRTCVRPPPPPPRQCPRRSRSIPPRRRRRSARRPWRDSCSCSCSSSSTCSWLGGGGLGASCKMEAKGQILGEVGLCAKFQIYVTSTFDKKHKKWFYGFSRFSVFCYFDTKEEFKIQIWPDMSNINFGCPVFSFLWFFSSGHSLRFKFSFQKVFGYFFSFYHFSWGCFKIFHISQSFNVHILSAGLRTESVLVSLWIFHLIPFLLLPIPFGIGGLPNFDFFQGRFRFAKSIVI